LPAGAVGGAVAGRCAEVTASAMTINATAFADCFTILFIRPPKWICAADLTGRQ
jgi:hypothetical protein